MNATLTDPATIPEIDLDPPVPCNRKGCENPPAWLGRTLCAICGRTWFPQCAPCRRTVDERVACVVRRGDHHCADHPLEHLPPPYVEWRPL